MPNNKNSLNLKLSKNTSKKVVYSHLHVDGIVKKEKIKEVGEKNTINKSFSVKETYKIPEKKEEKISDIKTKVVNENEINKNNDKSFVDDNKRLFLKVAGVAGLGLAASALFPSQTTAYIAGSAPTSGGGGGGGGTVGLKNIGGTSINPATEDTLALVQGNTSSVDTNIGTVNTNISNIDSNISSIKANTANIPTKGQTTMVNSMPVTIASDQPALPISGTMSFDASSRMTVDPSDSLFYLRKIVKQLEPLTTVDAANRQKVYIDGSASLTVTLATTAVTTIAGQGNQMYQDVARNTYANGVRNNLAFT